MYMTNVAHQSQIKIISLVIFFKNHNLHLTVYINDDEKLKEMQFGFIAKDNNPYR